MDTLCLELFLHPEQRPLNFYTCSELIFLLTMLVFRLNRASYVVDLRRYKGRQDEAEVG